MRRLKFKKWVTDLLIMIAFMAVMIASGECESNSLFLLKSIIGTLVFSGCSLLLIKYGNI